MSLRSSRRCQVSSELLFSTRSFTRYLTGSLTRSLVFSLMLSLIMGCDQSVIPPNANLLGMEQLAFHCVDLSQTPVKTAPLDRCGCLETSLDEMGARRLTETESAGCEGQTAGVNLSRYQLLGYVGSVTQDKVGVFDTNAQFKVILDQDVSIPGISHFASTGLISGLGAHPYGDFIFIIHGDRGSISLTTDYREHRPTLTATLDRGPLTFSAVWPKRGLPLPDVPVSARLYVSAPDINAILEVDLDLLSLALSDALAGEEPDLELFITREWSLLDADGAPINPGRVAINAAGDRLAVAHADTPRVSLFSLNGGSADEPDEMNDEMNDEPVDEGVISARALVTALLQPRLTCADAYVHDALGATTAMETCRDGADNDGDGAVDFEDSDCVLYHVESSVVSCAQRDLCADGIDNDDDGLVDADDPDCATAQSGERPYREGAAPECDDGIDNDGDGLIDRADDGCEHQDDDQEAHELERDALCDDGVDNDGDGLTDQRDPGCTDPDSAQRYAFERLPECDDGIDQDGDGLIDFGGDPDCTHAASRLERARLNERGLSVLELITTPDSGELTDVIVTHTPDGVLTLLELTELTELDPDAPVQLSQTPLLEVRYPKLVEIHREGGLNTLWVIDQFNVIHNVHLNGPPPLLTSTGERVYAIGESGVHSDSRRLASGVTPSVEINVEAYYVIRDNRAYQLPINVAESARLLIDPQTDMPLATSETRDAIMALDDEALSELPLLALSTYSDLSVLPQVFLDVPYQRLNARRNKYKEARNQSNRVDLAPQLRINNVNQTLNVNRHAGLCDLTMLEGSATGAGDVVSGDVENEATDNATTAQEESASCTLALSAGEPEDSALNNEPLSGEALTRAATLNPYPGVVVNEERYDRVISGRVRVTYEGALPGSLGASGIHLGSATSSDASEDDSDGSGESGWLFADYEADFCELGVEVGDLVVIDRMYPLSDALNDPECTPFSTRSPNEGIDPLRYRVSATAQHELTLVPDERESYAPQLDLLGSTRLPKLAVAPEAPPRKCAAAAPMRYEIRVGSDQWLVDTEALGYQHPWVSDHGRCVRAASRVLERRLGRATLGTRFENQWFSFQLGYQSATEGSSEGIPSGSLPFMIGASLEFSITRGALYTSSQSAGVSPQSMRWVPGLDRLFIVDSASQQITEYRDVNPHRDILQVVTTIR